MPAPQLTDFANNSTFPVESRSDIGETPETFSHIALAGRRYADGRSAIGAEAGVFKR
jgi:hypothetical protein